MRLMLSLAWVIAASAAAVMAQRAWTTGTWSASTDARVFVIESARDFISGEARDGDSPPASATAGTSVQFAIDGQTLYVLDQDNVERSLRLVGSTPKYTSNYSAIGGGHYIRAVAPGGTRVTLEDGSRWDIDPRAHFSVAGWESEDLITVRRSSSDRAFAFSVDNTSRDDGALANRLSR
jgi:hypothetical protein